MANLDLRAQAVSLAQRGFRVFPVARLGKVPAWSTNWKDLASCDPVKVEKMWTEPTLGGPQEYNIGVAGGEGPNGMRLVVVDVDVKGGETKGMRLFKLWESAYRLHSMLVRTPSGGLHAYLNVPKGLDMIGCGNGTMAPLIDIKGEGGYVVGPGSVLSNGVYKELNGAKVIDMPSIFHAQLLAKIGTPGSRAGGAGGANGAKGSGSAILVNTAAGAMLNGVVLDTPEAIRKAQDYLVIDAPESIQGANGDDTAYLVAAKVLDMGLSPKRALAEMLHLWDPANSPPWGNELQDKIASAWRNKQNKTPANAPASAEFRDITDADLKGLPPATGNGMLIGRGKAPPSQKIPPTSTTSTASTSPSPSSSGSGAGSNGRNGQNGQNGQGVSGLPMEVVRYTPDQTRDCTDKIIAALVEDTVKGYDACRDGVGRREDSIGRDGCVLSFAGRPAYVTLAAPAVVAEMDRDKFPPMPVVKNYDRDTLTNRILGSCVIQVPAPGTSMEAKQAKLLNRTAWKPTGVPEKLADQVLKCSSDDLPPLTGIVECPTLRADGTILDKAGYDAKTGLFAVLGDESKWSSVGAPDRLDAIEARQWIEDEFLKEFPFASAADRSVAIMALLTAVVRRIFIDKVPMFVFSSPTYASGKTELAKLICQSVFGRPPASTSLPEREEEIVKTLTAILSKSQSAVVFDNVATGRNFNSDALAQVLTTATFSARLLGTNISCSLPTNSLWMMTGVNLLMTRDMASRTLTCYLDPGMEDPESRTFSRDLTEWASANRDKAVHAALTIMKAYSDAGRPATTAKPSRFKTWDLVVRSAVVWALGEDVQEKFEDMKASDPTQQRDLVLAQALADLCDPGVPGGLDPSGFTVHDITAHAHAAANVSFGTLGPVGTAGAGKLTEAQLALHEALVGELGRDGVHMPTPKAIGAWLRSHVNKVLCGAKIVKRKAKTRIGVVWGLERASRPSPGA